MDFPAFYPKSKWWHRRSQGGIGFILAHFLTKAKLVHACVTSRLDYCNAILSGCANASLKPLQFVQNAAARILTRTKCFEHITPVLASLHWLPIQFHIDFKVLLITFKALNGLAPPHLKDLLHPYIPAQTLRSQNAGLLIVPRVGKCILGGRAFSYRAPLLWNNLPSDIHGADSLQVFKSRLKSYNLTISNLTDCLGSPSCPCQSPASCLLVMLP